jgi:rhodanese-related sulfurtransferase
LVSETLIDLGVAEPVGYYKGGVDEWKSKGEKVDLMTDIGCEELVENINTGKFDGVVIDIRNENETKMGYFTEAILLPMSKIKTHAFKVLKPEQLYFVHCAGGIRS